MASVLSNLVYFVGEETALAARAMKAVEWVASKPEGHAILEEAKRLYGQPVHIVTDPSFVVHNIGFGIYEGKPAVFINPNAIEVAKFIDEHGKQFPFSLERFFSHEFKHAAQPNLLEEVGAYAQRRQQYYEETTPEVPFEQYRHRIETAKNDVGQLKDILGEIYDTHIFAQAKAGLQRMMEKSAQDSLIQQFTAKYETPAIEFENLMMCKYKNEPSRTTDYVSSGIFDDVAWQADRQGFIDNAIVSLKAAEQQISQAGGTQTFRGGERTEPKPREGGWAEKT